MALEKGRAMDEELYDLLSCCPLTGGCPALQGELQLGS